MLGTQTHEQYLSRTQHPVNPFETRPYHQSSEELSGIPHSTLLHNPALTTHANIPRRASLLQSAQQTHGNRAIQRYIHYSAPSAPSLPPVQYTPLGGLGNELQHVPNSAPEAANIAMTPAAPYSIPIPYPNMPASRAGTTGIESALVSGFGAGMQAFQSMNDIMGGAGTMADSMMGFGSASGSEGETSSQIGNPFGTSTGPLPQLPGGIAESAHENNPFSGDSTPYFDLRLDEEEQQRTLQGSVQQKDLLFQVISNISKSNHDRSITAVNNMKA